MDVFAISSIRYLRSGMKWSTTGMKEVSANTHALKAAHLHGYTTIKKGL